MEMSGAIPLLSGLVLAPLAVGVVNRVKAWFAGRTGRPLLQLYFDIAKLMRKGTVYSETSSWVLRAGPVVSLSATVVALLFVPLAGITPMISFAWDIVLVAYLLGLARFLTVTAALDTASPFEGMGASREMQLSALAEPALILVWIGLTRSLQMDGSLGGISSSLNPEAWSNHAPTMALCAAALLTVLLAECSRVPFDDPNTHLELTMIHEAMVLDHGGPDLAYISYGASLKMWALGALLAGIAVPVRTGVLWMDACVGIVAILMLAAVVGVIESTMARLRLLRLPQLLVAANALAVLAFVLDGR